MNLSRLNVFSLSKTLPFKLILLTSNGSDFRIKLVTFVHKPASMLLVDPLNYHCIDPRSFYLRQLLHTGDTLS